MKRSCFTPVFVVVAMGAVPGCMRAQLADLPIKPGLWEVSATSSGGMGGGRTTTRQVCYSAKMTVDQYMAQAAQAAPGVQCTMSNKKITAQAISFDQSCTSPQMTVKGHTDIAMVDSNHTSSSTHMDMTGSIQGQPMNMTMDIKGTAKFVSADCGSVKPLVPGGAPK